MDNEIKTAVCSYVLIKIGDRDRLVPAVEKLYLNDHVLFCDAIDGDYDLALVVQGDSDKDLEGYINGEIKSINGVQNVEVLKLETPPATIIENAAESSGEDH